MAAFTFLVAQTIYLESAPAVVQSVQFSTTFVSFNISGAFIFTVTGYCVIVVTFRAEMNRLYWNFVIVPENCRHFLLDMF